MAGDRTKATLSPKDGYGERDESRIVQAPTADLPAGVAPGATVHAQLPNGGNIFMTVVAIDGPTATLDGNHPLAGRTLVFDVEVQEVCAATAGDLAHGHVHSPHCRPPVQQLRQVAPLVLQSSSSRRIVSEPGGSVKCMPS